MKKIKITAFILITAMLLSLIAACGNDSGGNSNIVPGDNNPAQQGVESGDNQLNEPKQEVKILPDVPEDLNLGGYNFRIIYNAKPEISSWGIAGIEAEEENGNLINDAAYTRNMNVTDKYNFELVCTPYGDDQLTSTVLRRIIQSGSDEYDLIIVRQHQAPSLITSGSFVDLNGVPYLDFDKPWWDQGIMKQISIAGKKFAGFGDLIVGANDALRVLMFNKELHRNAGLEDIYTLAKEGKWTLDAFHNMSRDISMDLNGDGVMDTDDRYGLILQQGGVVCFMFGAGVDLISKDENDEPFLSAGNERSLLALQKIWDIANAPDLALFDSAFQSSTPWLNLQLAFENNQGLFFGEVLNLVERMRATDTDFGVIPFPKYDEIQENYYTFADSWCMNQMFIPITNQNLTQTGQALEILNAESYYTVRPAYYDKSLNGKFMRDEESSEMLDIILANKVISLDELFGWGMFGALQSALTSRSPDFVSTIERAEERTKNNIARTVNTILELEF